MYYNKRQSLCLTSSARELSCAIRVFVNHSSSSQYAHELSLKHVSAVIAILEFWQDSCSISESDAELLTRLINEKKYCTLWNDSSARSFESQQNATTNTTTTITMAFPLYLLLTVLHPLLNNSCLSLPPAKSEMALYGVDEMLRK